MSNQGIRQMNSQLNQQKLVMTMFKRHPILEQVLTNVQNFLEKYLEAGIDKCDVVYDCDSDSRFLFSETSEKKIKLPPIFEKYICLKSVFPIETANKAPQCLKQMLQQLNLKYQGQQHCGADDSMNQARVGLELVKLGYNFSKDQKIKLGKLSTNICKEQYMKQYNMYKQEYLIQKYQNNQNKSDNKIVENQQLDSQNIQKPVQDLQQKQKQIKKNKQIQNQNNAQNIQQQPQNQVKEQYDSDEQNNIKENQNLIKKIKQNTINNKYRKHIEIKNSFEDAFWICKECNAKN
ncbi:hypothetical protein ABPG72_015065 [Tetrahymena utriculariae]